MNKELTTQQAADLRGVGVSTIKDWIYAGMPAEKKGRDWFIKESVALKYQPNKPGNPHTKR
jgi:excisionase family DNA binding protein